MTRSFVPCTFHSVPRFGSFRYELDHLFDEFFATENRQERPPATFAPRANLTETDAEYEVTVDVPGMKPDEFDLEFKDNQLSITGERKNETEERARPIIVSKGVSASFGVGCPSTHPSTPRRSRPSTKTVS